MISVPEALALVQQTASNLPVISLPIAQSLGYVVAVDVVSPIAFPPFNQSAMDGYAIADKDSESYVLKGEIKAGQDASAIHINKGETYRIFTGGMVPVSAWAVIRQEDAVANAHQISFTNYPKEHANIRWKSESVPLGTVILKKGAVLNPAAIGLIASLGIGFVNVYKKPTIAIVSTGDELVPSGAALPQGKIYESNGVMLQQAALSYGFETVLLQHTVDTAEATALSLQKALVSADYVFISGGVSVGDYDFVAAALRKIGVIEQFHKVKQKPGKPLFYGTFNDKKIFGFPGNPAAALTLFYIYALPSLQVAMGKGFYGLRTKMLICQSTLSHTESRAQFLKAIADEVTCSVTLLEGQSSAMLQTFAFANAFIFIDENVTIEVGQQVMVYLL